MSFKYNPLTGELNVFGVKEMNEETTPPKPPTPIEPSDSLVGFYAYVSTAFTNNTPTTWLNFQNLTIQKDDTKSLTEEGVFSCPTSGIYMISIYVSLDPSGVGNLMGQLVSSTPAVQGSLSTSFFGVLEKGVSYTFQFMWAPLTPGNPREVTVQASPLGSFISGKLLQAF